MKGDFSRRTFRSGHHYRAVLLQQGRVQLDADANEQAEITAHHDQMTALDTVGVHGGPKVGAGMAILGADGKTATDTKGADLTISPGRYYVDGILCENEDKQLRLAQQPDLPGAELPDTPGTYVAYLDVWTEHVTVLERPDLREVALGGPDTTTRERTVWQLKVVAAPKVKRCADLATWTLDPEKDPGTLAAKEDMSGDPAAASCLVASTGGYRRLENQLYRVEIHIGGDETTATYVWSRENGSVVAALTSDPVAPGAVITIDARGRDVTLDFAKKDLIELVDRDRVRRGEPGFLGELGDVDDTRLPVAWMDGRLPHDLGTSPVVRRWDSPRALKVADAVQKWVELEDGVFVQFGAGALHTGDYWLIPARSAALEGIGSHVQWPRTSSGDPVPQPPEGIKHRYAPVAVLTLAANGGWAATDCRRLFPSLTDQRTVGYAGGDGQEALPDEPLPRPLEVIVTSNTVGVAGALISFTAANPKARLALTKAGLGAGGQNLKVPTDDGGTARCWVQPSFLADNDVHTVTARLLDTAGQPEGPGITFSATLSLATRVGFQPGDCPTLAGATTVQAAINRLTAARSLAAVAGDGQLARPGTVLAHPVVVQVHSTCGPVAGANVTFSVDTGEIGTAAGALSPDPVKVLTDGSGFAECVWQVGDEPTVQQLTATLHAESGVQDLLPTELVFTADLDLSPRVAPGLHITDVTLAGNDLPLGNDTFVEAGQLLDGVRVRFDDPPEAAMIRRPVLTVTLDLPFPLTSADTALWGGAVVGTVPLTVAGTVTVDPADPRSALWVPEGKAQDLIGTILFDTLLKQGIQNVLGHLRVNGRAIASRDGRAVNGLAFGQTGKQGTALRLPSVDDVHGADFTLWFWLVADLLKLVVVPRRTELFRLKTARDALDLALPRDELSRALPGGVQVSGTTPADLDAARHSADMAFRNYGTRRIVLVADDRYAGAAALVRTSLSQADVEVEVITATDPADAARQRIAAGEKVDGVLTDSGGARTVQDLGGFADTFPL